VSLEPASLLDVREAIDAITVQFAVRLNVSENALRRYFYYNLKLTDKELASTELRLADLLVKWANREISFTELLTQLEKQMNADGLTFHF